MSARQTCTDHCAACGQHFHGLGAFDRHRTGGFDDPADPRRCAEPAVTLRRLMREGWVAA